MITILFTLITSLCSIEVAAQGKTEYLFGKPIREITSSCERNSQQLDILMQNYSKDDLIIIISHTGEKENKNNIGMRRLHNAKTYLIESSGIFKRMPDSIITGVGERVSGKGFLDFYVKGELALRIHQGLNTDLYFPPCVILPPDKACSTSYEKLFYPCKQ
jgi:hypothetical protein